MKFSTKLAIFFLLLFSGAASFLYYMGMFSEIPVERSKKGPYNFAYVEHIGPYSGVGKPMEKLDEKMCAAGFNSRDGIGLYYDDPKTTSSEELKSEVGFIIINEDMGKIDGAKEEFDFQILPAGDYAVAEFPIRNILSYMLGPMKVYPAIDAFVTEKNLTASGPGIEIYDMAAKKIFFLMKVE